MAEPNLPAYLDPFLDFLYDVLPPAVYEALMQIAATAIAVCAAAYSVIQAVVAARPWEWDAQVFLPPLIALGCVCILLYIVYRTILYTIRSVLWTIKWGIILGMLVAGIGYLITQTGGSATTNDSGSGGSGTSSLASALYNILTSSRASGQGAEGTENPRPSAWESFDRHREWQYRENVRTGDGAPNEELQRLMDNVVNKVRDGGVYGIAQGVMNAFVPGGGDRPRRTRPRRGAQENREDID